MIAGANERARAVGAMFERIAPRYDVMNRLMSLGLDGSWRARAVRAARAAPEGAALDIGAGTGDLTLVLARRGRPRRVVSADLSAAMLRRARTKARACSLEPRIEFLQSDVARLPFADASFACITTAFMVRNLGDLPAALRELRRTLRVGGRLVILEITRPRPGLAGLLFSLYFRRLVPLLGAAVSGDAAAYRYLPASVDHFLSAEALAEQLRAAGFRRVRFRRLGPGPVALHLAER